MLQFFLASAPIFAVVALGFATARLRLVAPQGFAAFAAYAFNLALPALMTGMLARQPLGRAFEPRFFAAILAAGLAVFVAVAVLTAALGRTGLAVAGSHAQAATGGNQAFLGVPLMLAVVGERATGPIAMVILAEVGILMPIGLACMGLGNPRAGASRVLAAVLARSTLLNPIVLGVAAGAALGLLGISLPAPIDRFLSFLGGSAGPVALFALGGTLAGQRLGEGWSSVLGLVVAKLVAYPALAWLLLRALGLGPDWVASGTLLAALPTAAYAFVFAQRFEAAPERISAGILLSTLAGAVTFPLTAWLVLP
jgi:malonate transporter and related proteins